MDSFRKHLSAPGLLSIIYQQFLKVPDPREFTKNVTISITDHLMSGLAVFCLKCPSLLDYDKKRSDNVIAQNLHDLYHVANPPSDTYLRERLDQINPDYIRPAFRKVFASFQRGKGLEEFEFIDGHVLISGDGTGKFSSSNICCPQCCIKELQNGTKTYYHQMFGACIVHPDNSPYARSDHLFRDLVSRISKRGALGNSYRYSLRAPLLDLTRAMLEIARSSHA